MELLHFLVDFVLHLDKHLLELVAQYGAWTYLILFAIIFCETGLVVTPFLPGDSLLFAAGAFAATGAFDLWVLLGLLSVAAILGDSVNYAIGRSLRHRLADKGRLPFVKPAHLEKTHAFYEKYGVKTIVIARFVPIVRTFAPFVAGVGEMSYKTFSLYNVVGGLLWVFLCTLGGYLFGNLPFVRENFSLVILGIIAVSLLPAVIEILRARAAARKTA
ncbi:MAG: DedA family protein [Thermoanaerobaculia bacterium]|nr:DedA family protein [Thermoanaerobaculia bacterium]